METLPGDQLKLRRRLGSSQLVLVASTLSICLIIHKRHTLGVDLCSPGFVTVVAPPPVLGGRRFSKTSLFLLLRCPVERSFETISFSYFFLFSSEPLRGSSLVASASAFSGPFFGSSRNLRRSRRPARRAAYLPAFSTLSRARNFGLGPPSQMADFKRLLSTRPPFLLTLGSEISCYTFPRLSANPSPSSEIFQQLTVIIAFGTLLRTTFCCAVASSSPTTRCN